MTLHSLLDRDVYRGGAIVVGPVRRGRGRRLRVERRVLPVTADENRRIEVFERELWRIAVEHLDYGEQIQWAALAGARVAPTGWRRARAMLHFDQQGELKRTFLLTALQRNKNPQLRMRALQEIAAAKDDEAFDEAVEVVGGWPRDEKREGVKVLLLALAERKLGRRDQANNWIWRCAEYTRELHEEYAVQRWPETKRLLGLLVNSVGRRARPQRAPARAGGAPAGPPAGRGAARGGAAAHAEAGEVINGARMRMSRKPGALARELLRNLPKGGKSKRRRSKRRKPAAARPRPPRTASRRRRRRSGPRRAVGRARGRLAPAVIRSFPPTRRRGRSAAIFGTRGASAGCYCQRYKLAPGEAFRSSLPPSGRPARADRCGDTAASSPTSTASRRGGARSSRGRPTWASCASSASRGRGAPDRRTLRSGPSPACSRARTSAGGG